VTAGDDTIVRRFADGVSRRGRQIVLRRISLINGQSPNPPVLVSPVTNGHALAGATHIAIRAIQAVGRIVAGDILTIGSLAPIAVAADVTAQVPTMDPAVTVTPGFGVVVLAAPLPSDVADGSPIVPAWMADQLVWTMERNFSIALQGTQIVAGDLSMVVAAFGVTRPNTTDQLLLDGSIRSIVNVGREMVRGQAVAWTIQAR
jgi:hypothetical protein